MVAVLLPEELRAVIDRQIAAGHAASAGDYLAEAVRHYANYLEAQDELAAVASDGIADIEAGRFVTIASPQEADELHVRTMARLREHLATRPGAA